MQMDLAVLFLRVCLGSIFVVHAGVKLGWQDISVFWTTENLIASTLYHLGPFIRLVAHTFDFLTLEQAKILAITAALIEFTGGCLLIIGFFTRFAALWLCLLMLGAIYYHLPNGFSAAIGGYEWALLCLAGSQVLLFLGSGSFSLDGLLRAINTAESRA